MELPLCRPGVARYAASWRGATDRVVQAALVEIRRTCVENGPRPVPDGHAAPFLPAARSCSCGRGGCHQYAWLQEVVRALVPEYYRRPAKRLGPDRRPAGRGQAFPGLATAPCQLRLRPHSSRLG